MMVYPSAELARTGDRAQVARGSSSLNGTWKFHGSLRPAERPLDFYRTDFDDAAWGTMPVPASWQMHGFDIPIYTNIIYPFPQDASKPPQPPYDFNPVGSYRMHFTVPPGVEGPARLPAFRRRGFGVLRLGERRRSSATARTAARPPSSTSRRT